jgi:hypothetical protein
MFKYLSAAARGKRQEGKKGKSVMVKGLFTQPLKQTTSQEVNNKQEKRFKNLNDMRKQPPRAMHPQKPTHNIHTS